MFAIIKPVRVPDAKPAIQQMWEMVHWGSRLLTTPSDYKTHGLYRKGVTRVEASRFLSGPRVRSILPPLNRDDSILSDKILFENQFRGAGLPVPNTLAIVGTHGAAGDRHQLTTSESIVDFIKRELGDGLVIKPTDSKQGIGVIVVQDRDGDELRLGDGSSVSLIEVATNLAESPATNMIQRKIIQHPVLDSLHSSSLNTIRLGTFRYRDGSANIDFAVLRMGRSGRMIDDYESGGVAVRIDLETGDVPGPGFQKSRHGLDRMAHHPDSNTEFSGTQIPFWDEVVSLAAEFARLAGDNRYVGWDVAITPEGPIFVEANDLWDAQLAQLGSDGLLTDHFVERMKEEADIVFEPGRLPPFRPIAALRGLSQ